MLPVSQSQDWREAAKIADMAASPLSAWKRTLQTVPKTLQSGNNQDGAWYVLLARTLFCGEA